MTFLEEAVLASKREAEERMRLVSASELESSVARSEAAPCFRAAISRGARGVRIIAEVKKMSPSAGAIRPEASAFELAREYQRGGADAISVLTSCHHFGGDLSDIEAAAGAGLPVLRKDFIVEPYQVLEARARGASAVLLITEALTARELVRLLDLAGELGMDALVECHGPAGLERALDAGAGVIGINNRDLETLEVDPNTTGRMLPLVPDGVVVVSESGIRTAADVRSMEQLGVDALLIGEALMRAENPAERLRQLKRGRA